MRADKPIDALAIMAMLVLCLSWAFQQIAVKWALPEMGVLSQGAWRSTLATCLVGAYMASRWFAASWKRGVNGAGLLAGGLFGSEFMMLYMSLNYTDASRAILFLYTAPFVVAIGSHFMFAGEKLNARSAAGVVLAFIGVAVMLNPQAGIGVSTLRGDLLALCAGIGWGLTTLVIRGTELRTAPAAQVLIYQLGASALMFVLAALVFGEALLVSVSRLVIWSVLYQGVWVAAITFLIWFALIARYPATGLSVITFMTPVFGALLGYWFLDESLGPRHLFSVSAVAVGIALVTRKKNARQPTET